MFCLNYYDNCLKATLNSTVVFQQTLSIFFTVETSQRLLATIVSMDINRQDQSDTTNTSDIYYMYLWFWSNKYGKLIVTVMCIKDYDLGMAVTSDFYNQTDRRRQPYEPAQSNHTNTSRSYCSLIECINLLMLIFIVYITDLFVSVFCECACMHSIFSAQTKSGQHWVASSVDAVTVLSQMTSFPITRCVASISTRLKAASDVLKFCV